MSRRSRLIWLACVCFGLGGLGLVLYSLHSESDDVTDVVASVYEEQEGQISSDEAIQIAVKEFLNGSPYIRGLHVVLDGDKMLAERRCWYGNISCKGAKSARTQRSANFYVDKETGKVTMLPAKGSN